MQFEFSEDIGILKRKIEALRSQALASTSFDEKRKLIKKIMGTRKALQNIKDYQEHLLEPDIPEAWFRTKESLTAIPLKNY